MEYHFKIHKEKDDYWAECLELKGCVTQGSDMDELNKNMSEALDLYLDEPPDSKLYFPMPKKKISGRGIVSVSVNPKIAFANYLRMLRLKKHLTQKQVAEILGMKNIYSYQRLETSKTANPALTTMVKLKEAFPEFDLNMVMK